MRLFALVASVGTLACLGGTARAAPADSAALFRVVASLVGADPVPAIAVVEESPARYRARRATLAVRGYSPAAQAHDAAVLAALGIPATRQTLSAAIAASQHQAALYDARTRRVHTLRSERDRRAATARAFVNGLQHRRYGLGSAAVTDRDARLAELAVGQGHAALVAARLGRVAAVPARGGRLERFLALERSFTSSVGLRFTATLQNLGGRRAVATALVRRPESTEQIFHIDKFLERERPVTVPLPAVAAGLARVSSGSFGELDVRTLLAVVDAPAVDATGSGWAGGRTAIYRSGASEAVVVGLAWDSGRDAEQWAVAVPAYVSRAFATASPTACAATSCWQIEAGAVAFHRVGATTSLAVAATADEAAAVALATISSSSSTSTRGGGRVKSEASPTTSPSPPVYAGLTLPGDLRALSVGEDRVSVKSAQPQVD